MIELYVLNKDLTRIAVIDTYVSLIWTVRYNRPGDFELYIPADKELLSILQSGFYLSRFDNDRIMIIERIEMTTDAENGNFFIVTGRSVESILYRRIVWAQTNLKGLTEECIRKLVTENVISPALTERQISNFKLGEYIGLGETMNMQVTGDIVGEVVTNLCSENELGWKVTLDDDKNFVFNVYKGNDLNVTFSREFDNLINSKYVIDMTNYANVALVAGEGEGTARITTSVESKRIPSDLKNAGIERYEVYVDSRDVSTNDGEITLYEYYSLLGAKGNEKLNETVVIKSFEGEVDPTATYRYKVDYDIGDKVNIENEYGVIGKSRIIEIIESVDEQGYSLVPTFEDWSV